MPTEDDRARSDQHPSKLAAFKDAIGSGPSIMSLVQNLEKIEEKLESAEGDIVKGAQTAAKEVISKVTNLSLPTLPSTENTFSFNTKPFIYFSERLNSENQYFSSLIRTHPAFVASVVSVFVVLPSALFGRRAVVKSVAYSFLGAYSTKAMFDWKWTLSNKDDTKK